MNFYYFNLINFNVILKILLILIYYLILGPVFEDECNCPESSLTKWLENNECNENNYNQLFENLKKFPSVNFDDIRNDIIKQYNKPQSVSICHYVVKSNKVILY